ncbi:hypothetical protein DEU56DRAFT_915012 [Suillus clintonianus]|uniref:uncharacterized protein n=1 Tax=Suillus clintonianus TaxID=1904413 RepID=UPI001B885547|nr:uncharacterized protein DEU56DRAFT_915012 [Suillus clintonianus]KAG2129750.1 hypothetical protein DEU56DRAFT_915012 [Suillus clintonianus]
MSKRARSDDDDEPGSKQLRVEEGNQTLPALCDRHAWGILRQFLTTNMTMPEMDDALASYLGDRYFADDWVEPRRALVSGEGDDGESLANLDRLMAKHVTPTAPSPPPKDSSASVSTSRAAGRLSSSRRGRSHGPPKSTRNPYIIVEASEDEDENDEEEEDDEDEGRRSEQSQKVMRSLGPSAKERLAKKIDDLANRFEENLGNSSQGRRALASRATSIPLSALKALAPQSRMYLLHIQRTATEYIAEHLRSQTFPVTVSAWVAGQLYVVADSPKTICDSLPTSHSLSVKQCLRITDAEREAVEGSLFQLPGPAWVKVKHGPHRGYIGRVESQTESSVKVLIPPSRFPYPMPRGTRALLERSRLPTDKIVSDIVRDNEVVGWTYEGQSYFMGLLLKDFLRDNLELLASPHIDDIRLHLESGWDKPFLKKTVVSFSMQFLRTGDWARVIGGSLRGELGQVISMDHAAGSASLDFTFDGRPEQIEVCLEDIERVFRVGDTVKVVAGPYLGLEGHVIQMRQDIFDICQDITNEQVEVSKYYLDRRPLNHTVHSQLPMQQYLEPPADSDSIEIGDHIEVLEGKHVGKRGVVDWYAKGSTHLWFRDVITQDGRETSSELSSIRVPVAMVRRTSLTCTIQYTKDKGYDVRPGDVVTVARGPEYQAKGVVHSVDIPNARLTILCDGDQSLLCVPIRFVTKIRNAFLDSFRNDIGREVFVIGGDRKGYRATLYSLSLETCTVAVHGQQRITLKLHEVVTRHGMKLNGVMLEGLELASFCEMRRRSYFAPPPRSTTPPVEKETVPSSSLVSLTGPSPSSSNVWSTWSASSEVDKARDATLSVNPTSSTHDSWTVGQDSEAEKLPDSGPLLWLMSKESSSKLSTYHMLLKVSPNFLHGRLHKRFVSTACPDPFCGDNGPAPEGYVAAFCTSNSAGATIEHHHIPASDLSPAHPRKKNQQCLVLGGAHRGALGTIVNCWAKKKTVDLRISAAVTINVGFDQICLVEPAKHMR